MIKTAVRKICRLPVIPRAVIFVPSAMALWWFLLKGASLSLLRIAAFLPLALLIAPPDQPAVNKDVNTGEWRFNVAVNAPVTSVQNGRTETVQSLEIAVDEDNVAFFAGGWFSFLALALSVWEFSKSAAKRLLAGLAVQTGINVLSLVAYVYINARGLEINDPLHPTPVVWLLKYAYHIIYLVLPFAGPFGVALLVFPTWRELFQAAGVPEPNRPDGIQEKNVRNKRSRPRARPNLSPNASPPARQRRGCT